MPRGEAIGVGGVAVRSCGPTVGRRTSTTLFAGLRSIHGGGGEGGRGGGGAPFFLRDGRGVWGRSSELGVAFARGRGDGHA